MSMVVNRVVVRWNKALASAWIGVLVTILTLVAGLFGSLYTHEAREAVKRWIPPSEAYATWIVVVVFGGGIILFFFRQRALDTLRDQAQSRLESATESIEGLIRTQPPAEFQQKLGVYYEKALVGSDKAAIEEDIAASIAVVVEGIAELARVFDNGYTNDGYGVNIMIFITPDEATNWFSYVRFLEQGVCLVNLAGLLALHPPFSAQKVGNAPAISPDPDMSPFALPIPVDSGKSKETGDGWRVLPGAPRAYVHRNFEHFSPATELATWCEQHGDFNQYVITKVRDYFKSTTTIAGFCSMPLFRPTHSFESLDEREVVGVLNLHWSSGRLFNNPAAAKSFGEAIFPVRALLARQLTRYFEQSGKKPQP